MILTNFVKFKSSCGSSKMIENNSPIIDYHNSSFSYTCLRDFAPLVGFCGCSSSQISRKYNIQAYGSHWEVELAELTYKSDLILSSAVLLLSNYSFVYSYVR